MEATYKTQAIVLQREPWNGNDSRVFIYTPDLGKLNLVARGTQKISSKLAAHLEPFNLCEIMIVKGRQYDYVGSCVSRASYRRIKSYYETAVTAAAVAKVVHALTREHAPDSRIFFILKKLLDILDAETIDEDGLRLITAAFSLKFISLLGYQPNFESLTVGSQKITPKLAHFMRMVLGMAFAEILALPIEQSVTRNFCQTVGNYQRYLFD
jgi:DNA repair protein RecO (recombination protein O)